MQTTHVSNETKVENKPTNEYRVGNVKITEWSNTIEDKVFKSYQVSKIYKDGEEWKTTNSFGYMDLIRLQNLLQQFVLNNQNMEVKTKDVVNS